MKTAYFTLLISVLAVSVLAGSYQVVYQEQIAGAELFTYIDPVIDTSTLPQGFIFADPSVRQFVYRLISAESTIVFSTSNKPVMTLNVRAADSLLIFALSRTRIGPGEFLGRPELRRICLTGGIISDSSAVMTYPGWWGNVVSIWYERIAFDSPPPNASGVILEQCVYWDNYETTQGWEYKAISGARLFGFDLRPGSTMMPVTSARPANLTDDPGKEFAWYNKYYYSYDFRDSADDPNFGPWDQLYSGVSLNSGDTLISCWSNHGGYLRIFAEDLIPGNALDEVLFYGYAVDMTGQHGAANHAACYSFASGAPEEIWYTPLSGITLDYVYKPQHFIAGMRGANKVIALNYWTGLLCDSINLDRNLTATTFFETGSDPSSLNLSVATMTRYLSTSSGLQPTCASSQPWVFPRHSHLHRIIPIRSTTRPLSASQILPTRIWRC